MTDNQQHDETLSDIGKRLKKSLEAADTGPLIAAADVMRLAENWSYYRAEADGLSCTSWLMKTLGRGKSLAWFAKRRDAVLKLGESSRRTMHHEVAVWLVNRVTPEYWDQVKRMLAREAVKNGGNPLTMQMAKPKVFTIIGKPEARHRVCLRCEDLEKRLRELGANPDEGIGVAAE